MPILSPFFISLYLLLVLDTFNEALPPIELKEKKKKKAETPEIQPEEGI